MRCENSIHSISAQNFPPSSPVFLSIEKSQNGYTIKADQGSEMWLVIDCNKAKYDTKGYKVNTGEIIKLGRVKYIVKEVCGYEEETQIPVSNEFVPSQLVDTEQMLCRICLVGEEDRDPLISPCNCGGTMKFIHLSCFRK